MMGKRPVDLTRRKFVQLALAGTAAALVEAACRGTTPAPSPAAETTTAPSPSPQPAAAALPPLTHATPAQLANRDDAHYNVRYAKPFAPVDHAAWRLEIGGLVEAAGRYSLADLSAWPQMEQVSRMACVEGWSFRAKWGGFQYQALVERVKPRPEATHLRFDCADGYWEVARLEEIANPRVIFVLRMNDELLLDEYGAPLRMMFPAKYGYKSAKAVTSITFTDQEGRGFWSTVGLYSVDGGIEPGVDYPQDLQGQHKIDGGEITAY